MLVQDSSPYMRVLLMSLLTVLFHWQLANDVSSWFIFRATSMPNRKNCQFFQKFFVTSFQLNVYIDPQEKNYMVSREFKMPRVPKWHFRWQRCVHFCKKV